MRIAFTHNLKTASDEAQAEFDTPETINTLTAALTALGHQVRPVDVGQPVADLVAELLAFGPDVVFNTAEGRHGPLREAFYPQLFEELGLSYTGSGPHACVTTLDKHLTKLVALSVGVDTPPWAFVRHLDDPWPARLKAPVIVKPAFEGSSKGIDAAGVFDDLTAARAAVAALLVRYPDGVMVEAFIEGEDVVAPWIEGVGADGVLPIAGYAVPDDPARRGVYDFDLKNVRSDDVQVVLPARLSAEATEAIQTATVRLVRALGVRDLCRLDFRIDGDGRPWFLELNALPSLEPGASIYAAAAYCGLPDEQAVLAHLVARAAARRAPDAHPEAVRVGLVYNLRRAQATADGAHDQDAEFDAPTTIEAIAGALRAGGHHVVPIEADSRFLRRMGEARVDLVFNVAEGLRGRGREALVPAVLDLLDIPHTGSDAVTLAVTLDKALAKRVVRDAGLATAPFVVVDDPQFPWPEALSLPVVVKPVAEGSSKGVGLNSVARTEAEVRAMVAALRLRYDQPVLVESFLPGREFTLGLIAGPAGPEALPPLEIVFETDDPHPVYAFAHKLGGAGVRYEVPAKVDAALAAKLEAVAVGAWHALGCRDVARVDVRLAADGTPCFIECNPLPGLVPDYSDLCLAAAAAGLDHTALVQRILAPALARLRAQRRAVGAVA